MNKIEEKILIEKILMYLVTGIQIVRLINLIDIAVSEKKNKSI